FSVPSDGNSLTEQTWNTSSPNWGSFTWQGDFNGDGLMDIATVVAPYVYVSLSNGHGFAPQAIWCTTSFSWPGTANYTYVGDFDGDGKTDLAASNNGQIWVLHSTGTSFTQQTWMTSSGNWGSWTWVADFNGDGKADIATLDFWNT